MARAVTAAYNDVILGHTRRPSMQVLIYDVVSTSLDPTPTRINDVVAGNPLPSIVGPLDVTPDLIPGSQLNLRAGDYLTSGIAAGNYSLSLQNTGGEFDPLTGSNSRYMRQGNVVRLVIGDLQIPEDQWHTFFTGLLTGAPGVVDGRRGGQRLVSLNALGREAPHNKRIRTSDAFDEATTYLAIANAVAQNVMKLSVDELDFPSFGSQTTGVDTTQLVEVSPLVMLAQIAFLEGLMPSFNGEGKLTFTDSITTKPSARVYVPADGMVSDVVRPAVELNGVTKIFVRGLNPNRKKVVSKKQELNTMNVTLGFFTPKKRFDVFYSEDKKQLAQDVTMKVVASVDSGLLPLGGESFVPQIDPVTLISRKGELTVKSGYAPTILATTTVALIAAAAVPDLVEALGVGVTTPVGRIAQMAIMIGVLTLMQTEGAGIFTFRGKPVEWVYKEVAHVTKKAGIASEDHVEADITNHMIQTKADCKIVSERILTREQQKQNRRSITAVFDPVIEPDDVFENDDTRRYYVQGIGYRFGRGVAPEVVYDAFEVTGGVLP